MMWMVENDDERRLKMGITDHPLLHGRKLRPLMPRPMVMRSSKEEMTMMPCSCCIKNPNLLHLHHAQYNHGHQEKAAVAAVSTTPRWNPTPEQLQALEEMYRRGVRTPSAEQIQQIASKLTRFGKIQGKNVFYWFQNHKARERQKKRRHLIIQSQSQSKSQSQNNIISLIPHINNTSQSAAGAGAGVSSRRSHMEIEDHHKLATPSLCHQGSASMQAGAVIRPDHFRQDEWTQLQLLIQSPPPLFCTTGS